MKQKSYKTLLLIVLISLPFLIISCGNGDSDNATVENQSHDHSDEIQLWTCGMHPEVILEEPGQCPKCGMNLVPLRQSSDSDESGELDKAEGKGKILYWQAPMNPSEIYDAPGKSKMGMDLVPVYDSSTGSELSSFGFTVRIDPATVQNMGVRTALVQKTDFTRIIRTVGKVDYNEEKTYVVTTKITGWIEKLQVNITGQPVRRGQTLLEIYSPDLVTTQQEYLLALKNREVVGASKYAEISSGAETLVRSTRQRLVYWDIPESDIRQLEKTGKVRKTLRLTSPINGIVTHKNAMDGGYVKEGMKLYEIADLSTVWVYASIYDDETPWIFSGQEAEIELSYDPGRVLRGKVSYIYPYLDEKTRDTRVRIVFANPGLKLKPGMYANVKIATKPIRDAIVIPTEAVIRSGQRDLVFVSRGNGRFQPREVRTGEESGNGMIRVISGLAEGEEIVISAQFLLDSESRLQEAIRKMLDEKKAEKEERLSKAEKIKKNDFSQKSDMKCGSGKCGGSN